MIRRFDIEDLRSFDPNEYSNPAEVVDALADPNVDKFSLIENGVTQAIMVAQRYWGNNYAGFFLISEHFRKRNAFKLREFVHSTHERFGVKRIQTESPAVPVLDAWHKFLGFTLEGTKRKMMKGMDFNCWGLNMGMEV